MDAFRQGLSALSGRLEPSALRLRSVRSGTAKRRPATDMPLSRRLAEPALWAEAQAGRRRELEELIASAMDGQALERAADLVCAVCEESSWAGIRRGRPFPEDAHPEIDSACAQTALLLGWTAQQSGAALDAACPGILAHMLHEARRRAFLPALSHDDYAFMLPSAPDTLSVSAALAEAALMLETDVSRRSALLKKLGSLLDAACQALEFCCQGQEGLVREAAAATDLAQILYRMTRGGVDLTQSVPMTPWLDAILAAHGGRGLFFNPRGGGMKPGLCGADVYRLGTAAGDDALMALGASLDRQLGAESASVTGRLLSSERRAELDGELRRVPRLKHAVTASLATGRGMGFQCALCLTGARRNAGDVLAMLEDAPLLADAGIGAHPRNLPVIGGVEVNEFASAGEPECELGRDRTVLSADLSRAYPREAGVIAFQRTLIVDREKGFVRLIDALEMREAAEAAFRFVCAARPEPIRNGALLGGARLTFEEAMPMDVSEFSAPDFPDGLWLIRISRPLEKGRTLFSCTLERA